MAKDYFQDIILPEGANGTGPLKRPARPSGSPDPELEPVPRPDRGIRSVNIPQRPKAPLNDMRPALSPRGSGPLPQRPSRNRSWLWALTGLSLLALAALLFLFVFRKTSVSVVPQSQVVTFDDAAQFTAYPASTAPEATISYQVHSADFEDSEVVASTGTTHVETKASARITVVNDYSISPVKLRKSTRFETQDGLIFRVPADVSVPGKTAAGPGKVNVVVVADSAGERYNIGPQERFTLPGLRSSAAEYTRVYAYALASSTGGFSGEQPVVAPSDMDTARTKSRARMQEKASSFVSAQTTDTDTVLGSKTTYSDLPNTPEAGNMVRVHQSAHVEVAVAPSSAFASVVAQSVAANAPAGSVTFLPGKEFSSGVKDTASAWGNTPLVFSLSGRAHIVWIVDAQSLAKALAGRDNSAFEMIVSNFPGVRSAHARIEPFWNHTFPSNPDEIHVTVQPPKIAQ